MTSKIKAAIRVRPFLPSQIKNGYKNTRVIVDQKNKQICINEQSNRKVFHFDYLFPEQTSQQELYHGCKIDSIIDKAIQGYHSTIFAYGQTGSGKTFTMQGNQSVDDGSGLSGLIPKAISSLFKKIKNHSQSTFMVSVSFLQIYNEKVFDLLNPISLNPKNIGTNVGGLRLRWNKHEQFNVQNLFIFECKNENQLLKYFLLGLKNRINSSHKLNMSSSRSHSILSIRLQSYHHEDPTNTLYSRIELVDLAGSQRIGITGTQGKLAKQSIDINKSLFTLRQVISILSDTNKNKSKDKIHVPYRDSKLTSILKQSIGGNSYSLMIACITPNDNFSEQNLSTLTYATKASYINNKPVINDDPKSKIILELKSQIKILNSQLNKANQHIQFISNINEKQKINQIIYQNMNKNEIKIDKKKTQQKDNKNTQQLLNNTIFNKNGNYNQFSQRLVQSINMVRQLLKNNKQLRQQLQTSNIKNQQKDIQIYQLTRQNQNLRDNLQIKQIQTTSNRYQDQQPNISTYRNARRLSGRMGNTGTMWKIQQITKTNVFNNYQNSIEINQYYLNEKGVDSMPTNFNKRDINSANNNRNIKSRGNSQDFGRQTITSNSTKRSWMSKNSQNNKNLLSFYNDPTKDQSFIY